MKLYAIIAGIVFVQAFVMAPTSPPPLTVKQQMHCADTATGRIERVRDNDCALIEFWTLCPDLPGMPPTRNWVDACEAKIRARLRGR